MQEPTARKRGRRPEAREGQGQKPGIFLKVLPSEEYCRLKPMPEKTRPLGFEQKQGIAIWYCQSVNPALTKEVDSLEETLGQLNSFLEPPTVSRPE
jgi:hypothetical protein